jgi:hypothetical protein
MFVLDDPEIEQHQRYKYLVADKGHRTGHHPRKSMIVLTSIAMLSNFCHAEKLQWRVQGAIDGTHTVSTNNYVMITFGFVSVKPDGTRQFFPVAFAIGAGEREIVAYILYENVKKAVKALFGFEEIPPFQGGIVSDHTNVFTNAGRECFPLTLLMMCFTHIIRKFITDDIRKENGGYKKYLTEKDRQWLGSVAHHDVTAMYHMKSEKAFRKMAEAVKAAWEAEGERKLAHRFWDSYIAKPEFNKWFYCVSGIPGCIPENNPHEAFHLQSKGCDQFRGMARMKGIPFADVLYTKLPLLIKACSMERVGMQRHYPVLDIDTALKNEIVIRAFEMFDTEMDIVPHPDGIGWLVNDLKHMATAITPGRIEKYLKVCSGDTEINPSNRHEIHDIANSLHHVTEESNPYFPDEKMMVCNCTEYYSVQHCIPTLLKQHWDDLLQKCQRLPNVCPKRRKVSKQERQRRMLVEVSWRIAHQKRALALETLASQEETLASQEEKSSQDQLSQDQLSQDQLSQDQLSQDQLSQDQPV